MWYVRACAMSFKRTSWDIQRWHRLIWRIYYYFHMYFVYIIIIIYILFVDLMWLGVWYSRLSRWTKGRVGRYEYLMSCEKKCQASMVKSSACPAYSHWLRGLWLIALVSLCMYGWSGYQASTAYLSSIECDIIDIFLAMPWIIGQCGNLMS